MYYEINVSLKGWHFFATSERSIQTEDKLRKILKIFLKTFPQTEGYEISITKFPQIGEGIPLNDIFPIENILAYDFKLLFPAHLSKLGKPSWSIFRIYSNSYKDACERLCKLKCSSEVETTFLGEPLSLTDEDTAFILTSPFDYRVIDNSYIIKDIKTV